MCALWSSGIVAGPAGVTSTQLYAEVARMRGSSVSNAHGNQLAQPRYPCTACGQEGAMIGCFVSGCDAETGRMVQCPRQYHYGCAVSKGCVLAVRGQHPASNWFPQRMAYHLGRRNALYCARGSCEIFGCSGALQSRCRDYHCNEDDMPLSGGVRKWRRYVDELIHAHSAYRATCDGRPWRAYRVGEDVLLNTGAAPWPCRILKIFWEVEDDSEPWLEDSEGLQMTVQWYHRPGEELLEEWSQTRKDEVVWISPEPGNTSTFGTNWA